MFPSVCDPVRTELLYIVGLQLTSWEPLVYVAIKPTTQTEGFNRRPVGLQWALQGLCLIWDSCFFKAAFWTKQAIVAHHQPLIHYGCLVHLQVWSLSTFHHCVPLGLRWFKAAPSQQPWKTSFVYHFKDNTWCLIELWKHG